MNFFYTESETGIAKLVKHAKYLLSLEKKLCEFLPPPIGRHCKIASVANNTLLLFSDSPAWATKLRYQTPQILEFMKSECNLDALQTIRIKIKPDVTTRLPVTAKKARLSKSASDMINKVADTMPDDELRLSLRNIASHSIND